MAEIPLTTVLAGGGYFSLPKIIVTLVFFLPFIYLAPLVQKDAKRILAPEATWSLAVLAVAMVSMLLLLLIPYFLIGLLLYLVLIFSTFGAYVAYRNGRVGENARIFTREHLLGLLRRDTERPVEVVTRLKLYREEGKNVLPPSSETSSMEEVNGYNLSQELLYDILWRRASEADITPAGREARVRFVIDGVISERPSLDAADSEMLVEYIKPIAGMDGQERRRPQHGKISVDLAGSPIAMEVTTAGTTGGQRLRLRVVQEVARTDLNTLGISKDVLAKVRKINKEGAGLVIVSSRGGNGLTSTMYSLLREHDAFVKQIVSLESKPTIDLENITQHAYGQAEKLPQMLASVMRRDPDVILVDACRDAGTAEMILQASAGKMVLLGIPASDTFTAMAKWVKIASGAGDAMKPLRAVLCQILIRKLCTTCREAYRPDPNLLAKINLPAERIDKFYRPPTSPLLDEKGQPYTCPSCQGSGYLGRTAAFELLEVTDEIRDLVAGGKSLTQIKAMCRKNGMLYLQEQALRKVISGETSIQEVVRVTQPAKTKKRGKT